MQASSRKSAEELDEIRMRKTGPRETDEKEKRKVKMRKSLLR